MNEELKKVALSLKANCVSRITCKGCPFERAPVNKGPGVNSSLLIYKCKLGGVPQDWLIGKEQT